MKIQVFWSTTPWFRVTYFSEELVTYEMSVLICHSTLRHIPGDPSLRQHRTENLSNYQSVERLLFLTTITSRFFSDFFCRGPLNVVMDLQVLQRSVISLTFEF